jgi:hypothetical protein
MTAWHGKGWEQGARREKEKKTAQTVPVGACGKPYVVAQQGATMQATDG